MEKIWLKSYPEHVPENIDLGNIQSIMDLWDNSCRNYPNSPAFANFGHTLSFAEIDALVADFAAWLQAQSELAAGDRIAIMMPNLLQYPIALLGALRAGLVVVNVNPLYTARELKHQLKDSGAKAIVVLEHFAATVQEVLPDTDVKIVLTTEVGDMLKPLKGALINFVLRKVKKMIKPWHIAHAQKFKAALQQGASQPRAAAALKLEDLAFLQYTGGTTGLSKGAMLSHSNIVSNVLQAKAYVGNSLQDGKEVAITALPLYHIFSLTANLFYISSIGGLNVLITNPREFAAFVKELKKWPFSFITGVNTLFNALLNTEGFDQVDFSNLKVSLGGGMAVTQGVADRWQQTTGHVLLEAYGLTETSPAVCINPTSLQSYNGAIGLPISSTDIQILGEQEKELGVGEEGELCVKGPQVMSGYWQRDEENKQAFSKAGYFKTGDYAAVDEQGFVRILDRKKDMINVSGFNVYPNEIENIVSTMDGINECAAIGVPDDASGEKVKLFVVRSNSDLSEAAILDFCAQNLTNYKRPKVIAFVDDLPKTNVGKILRRELRD